MKAEKHLENIDEALNDVARQLDQIAIDYAMKNYRESKAAGVKSQMEQFAELARKETDPLQREFYYHRMFLPPDKAWNMAREFYQKEIRSGTGTGLDFGDEGEFGDQGSVLNFSETYGNATVDKGLFSALMNMGRRSPERELEVGDFVTKYIKSLSDAARIVLIARLMTGSSTGRSRRIERAGLDIKMYMKELPEEYKIVADQIRNFVREGKEASEISATQIINGENWIDDEKVEHKVPRILAKWEITQANKELQDKMKDLAGAGDYTELEKFMYVNEARDDNLRPNTFLKVLNQILNGGRVRTGDMIKAIIFAIDQNYKHRTPLSRSRAFKRSVKDTAKYYLKLAKSRKPSDQYKVQDLFMAPMLIKKDPLKLKKRR